MKSIHLMFLLTVAGLTLESVAAPPNRVPSFGPNGTHWPGQITGLVTPYMYDETIPHRIEVACDWGAIRSAISGLSSQQVSEGVLILVQPGTLTSLGGAHTSTSVLNGVGDKTWTKRVTVAPRDGWGSVQISGGGGVKFTAIRNICLAGFPINGSLRIVSSTRFAFVRCTVTGYISCYGYVNVENEYRQYEFVELVKRDVRTVPDDVMQLQVPQSGATDHVWQTIMDGCYFAPNYCPVGSSAHQDTIQHLGANNIWGFKGGTIQDTVVFSSKHSAINGGLIDTMVRNCWLNARVGNQTPRYPIPDGYVMDTGASVNNGSMDNMMFDGGYVMGGLRSNQGRSDTPYGAVTGNATIDYTPTGYTLPTSGAWNVDTALNGHTKPGYPQLPTDSYLLSIWSKNASLPGQLPGSGDSNPDVLSTPTGLIVLENHAE